MNEIEWKPSYFILKKNKTKTMEYNSLDAVDLTMTASTEYPLDDASRHEIYFTFKIDWKKMKESEDLIGDCQVYYYKDCEYKPIPKFELEFTKNQSESIKIRVGKFGDLKMNEEKAYLHFELRLKPLPGIPRNKLSNKTENLDGILIIEGHKVPVSKSLLSVHSEYFKSLFGSDFKEKNMDEIPIEDVKIGDFINLMNFLWLKSFVLNDNTVEGLLELANRFLMPFVMDQIEDFLMNTSKLEFTRLFYLSEKYNFEQLKEKCIGEITKPIHVKNLRNSKYFAEFSQKTKDFLIDKIFELTT